MEKYRRAGQTTDDNMALVRFVLDNLVYKYTLRICNNYLFYTATMVARMCLNFTVYVYCLYCYGIYCFSNDDIISFYTV